MWLRTTQNEIRTQTKRAEKSTKIKNINNTTKVADPLANAKIASVCLYSARRTRRGKGTTLFDYNRPNAQDKHSNAYNTIE